MGSDVFPPHRSNRQMPQAGELTYPGVRWTLSPPLCWRRKQVDYLDPPPPLPTSSRLMEVAMKDLQSEQDQRSCHLPSGRKRGLPQTGLPRVTSNHQRTGDSRQNFYLISLKQPLNSHHFLQYLVMLVCLIHEIPLRRGSTVGSRATPTAKRSKASSTSADKTARWMTLQESQRCRACRRLVS